MLVDWSDVAETAIVKYGAQQDADELTALLCILDGLIRPVTILEIGAGTGGSAWTWSQLPTVRRIITVDKAPTWPPGIQRSNGVALISIEGDSSDVSTRVRVTGEIAPGDADMVYIDADHTYESASADLGLYGPLVARDGIIVMHDSQGYPGREDFGVGRLISEVRQKAPVLEIYSRPGGPAGTAIIWANERNHGLTYNERETWRR